MSRIFFACLLLATLVVAGCKRQPQPEVCYYYPNDFQFNPIVHKTNNEFVGRVKFESVSIRLLVLKHSTDSMVEGDTRLAVQAADLAASKGLKIKDIGSHYVNRNGKMNRHLWGRKMTIDQFKVFVTEQMKVEAEPGDTLIVFTIGHGFGGGDLQNLGQRRDVMNALAAAAEENDQEVLWWQLSCHACARMPKISELNERQQELFSICASSTASQLSAAYVQGKHMEKVFMAMAEKSADIDPNRDEIITAKELADFMNTKISRGRGDLVFAKSPDEPIFGLTGGLANQIPITDRNGQQGKYPRNYIPMPRK